MRVIMLSYTERDFEVLCLFLTYRLKRFSSELKVIVLLFSITCR